MSRRSISSGRFWRWEAGAIRSSRSGIPLSDRGFRYGQHVFESIAVRGGRVLLGTEHLRLLAAAARRHRIPCPSGLLAALDTFLDTASLADGMLRIYLTAGPGTPGGEVVSPGCYLSWEASPFPSERDLEKGYALKLVEKTVAGAGWHEKSGNYAVHLEAFREARKSGCDEGIVCDDRGRVVSCAMGNLLVWLPCREKVGGIVLLTPSGESEARAGAVLGWVKRSARAAAADLQGSDLRRAAALAVTNSRIGVMPVASLDGRKLPRPDLALRLARRYLSRHGLSGTP